MPINVWLLPLMQVPRVILLDLESELHVWRSGGVCRSPQNGKSTEIKEALSTDQVLLWSVSLLHSLIIVISCLVMTQSSSTENHYPGCVMR